MYLIFSPHHEFTPIRVDGGEDMQSGSLALTIASTIADALGEAIIHNGISHRTHRLLRADESTDATAELLADDEAMARIAEGERELAERYPQTGGREPTVEPSTDRSESQGSGSRRPSAEELRPYRGLWVAVRGGQVIRADKSPADVILHLRRHSLEADSFFQVPLDPSRDWPSYGEAAA